MEWTVFPDAEGIYSAASIDAPPTTTRARPHTHTQQQQQQQPLSPARSVALLPGNGRPDGRKPWRALRRCATASADRRPTERQRPLGTGRPTGARPYKAQINFWRRRSVNRARSQFRPTRLIWSMIGRLIKGPMGDQRRLRTCSSKSSYYDGKSDKRERKLVLHFWGK